jgi:hypothetical protein
MLFYSFVHKIPLEGLEYMSEIFLDACLLKHGYNGLLETHGDSFKYINRGLFSMVSKNSNVYRELRDTRGLALQERLRN